MSMKIFFSILKYNGSINRFFLLLVISLDRCVLCFFVFCLEKFKYCIFVNLLIEEFVFYNVDSCFRYLENNLDNSCKWIG